MALMLLVNLLVVDTVHPKSNKFATGVKIKSTGESELIPVLLNVEDTLPVTLSIFY